MNKKYYEYNKLHSQLLDAAIDNLECIIGTDFDLDKEIVILTQRLLKLIIKHSN
jgi:hypothetical protein